VNTNLSSGEFRTFRFLPDKRFTRFSFRLTAALFALAGIIAGGGLLVTSARKILESSAEGLAYAAVPLALLVIGWTIMSACATVVISADIAAGEAGIVLRLAAWRQISIPWQRLRGAAIRARDIPLPYRRKEEYERLYTVAAPGLSLVFRLAALYYGFGLKSMFVITPDHESFETLVAWLEAAAHPPAQADSPPSA
jgi:hypothetical protein